MEPLTIKKNEGNQIKKSDPSPFPFKATSKLKGSGWASNFCPVSKSDFFGVVPRSYYNAISIFFKIILQKKTPNIWVSVHNYFYNSPERTDAVGFPHLLPTCHPRGSSSTTQTKRPRHLSTKAPCIWLVNLTRPPTPPPNSRPYDQRLWKPIGFPKKKAGDMIHPAISGGENSSSPGSHIPKKTKNVFKKSSQLLRSCC